MFQSQRIMQSIRESLEGALAGVHELESVDDVESPSDEWRARLAKAVSDALALF